jgi:hypothetical protein
LAGLYLDILRKKLMICRLIRSYYILMIVYFSSSAQISPGKLSRGHEHLEGMSNCTQCHDHGDAISSNKCLACHTEIREAINNRHGFHFLNASTPCIDCHKEHLGLDASITLFDKNKFDHIKTGFPLTGKHTTAQCYLCHAANKITNAAIRQSLTQYPRQTYLGIQQQCIGCHADRHGGTLGTNCQNCHDPRGWVPAATFVHAATKFPLSGKHGNVACSQCHQTMQEQDKTKPILFTVKSFDDCKSCHSSPHGDRLSKHLCRSCHIPEGWKVVRNFNHSNTAFTLIGKHTSVVCSKCHLEMANHSETTKNEFKTKQFADCTPCHASPHAPSFSKKACSSCHTPLQWATVSEKGFDHSLTSFPLRGKHVVVECRKCHETKGKQSFARSFKLVKNKCSDCHEDRHKGEFQRTYANDCSRCHNEESYSPSTFTLEQHQHSRFPLTGGHTAIPCRSCHLKQGELTFQFNRITCEDCHHDKHEGQFIVLMKNKSCDACHSTDGWSHIAFDHGQTKFPLIGKHSSVACEKCHIKKSDSASPQYQGTSSKCSDCHTDSHRQQFSEAKGETCSGCHTPAGWNNFLFNHNAQSTFLLTGAHTKVLCSACHPQEQVDGKFFVRYKPISSKCESCHQGKL